MSIAAVHKVQISPLNEQSSYSFKNGNPIINFQIGRQQAMLDTTTLRLHFKLAVKGPDGNTPVNPGKTQTSNGDAINSTVNTQCRINERVGVHSIFERVVVSESSRNQTMENVRDIGRILAATRPASFTALEYNQNLNAANLCGTRENITAGLLNHDQEVSIKLSEVLGCMTMGALPLNLVPLNLSFHLAPDSQVLIVDATRAAANQSMTYTLSNVFLTADLHVPDGQMAAQMAKEDKISFSYDSYHNLYNIQNSTNQTTSSQWGLSRVKSVFATVMQPTHQNNFDFDSFATPEMQVKQTTGDKNDVDAQIDRVSYLKASLNFPVLNEMEVLTQSKAKLPLTPVLKHGLSSVGVHNKPYAAMHTICDLMTQCQISVAQTPLQETQDKKLRIFGVAMDEFGNYGLDYRDVAQGLRMNLDLAANTESTAMGIHSTAIATNTLVIDKGAISVLS